MKKKQQSSSIRKDILDILNAIKLLDISQKMDVVNLIMDLKTEMND